MVIKDAPTAIAVAPRACCECSALHVQRAVTILQKLVDERITVFVPTAWCATRWGKRRWPRWWHWCARWQLWRRRRVRRRRWEHGGWQCRRSRIVFALATRAIAWRENSLHKCARVVLPASGFGCKGVDQRIAVGVVGEARRVTRRWRRWLWRRVRLRIVDALTARAVASIKVDQLCTSYHVIASEKCDCGVAIIKCLIVHSAFSGALWRRRRRPPRFRRRGRCLWRRAW